MAISANALNTKLIVPGGYVQTNVQSSVGGLATTGVLMLVGEADSGPDYTLEDDLDLVTFGPDQQSDVIAKYKSGNIVNAFRGAVAAADDPQIQGSFSRCIIMKTNVSTKASGALSKIGGGDYGTLYDQSYGKLGNMISYEVTEDTAESVPSTGSFTMLLPIADYDIAFRVNGGAAVAYSAAALETPATFVTNVAALSGVIATGGTDRSIITVSGTLALAVVSGNRITLTRSIAWATTPSVGDTLYIPAGSVVAGGSSQNCGSYVVTAATSTVISATKLRNATGSPGTVTAPVAVGAASIVAVTDAKCFAPVVISQEAGSVVDGVGKTLEIASLDTGTDLFENYAYALNTTAVDWISTESAPVAIDSDAEYGVQIEVARQTDNVLEQIVVNGQNALKLGYLGTTAALVVSDTTLSVTVVGGAGANLSITLSDFATIADLAAYIDAQPGYNAELQNATIGQYSPTLLDNVTASCASTWGAPTGNIKIDAYNFYTALLNNSILVQLGDPAEQAASGLPDVSAVAFLSGGAKGSTSDAQIQGAIDMLEGVRGNFLVPLFSRDASEDILDDLTDSGSTYTIDAINAYAKSHVVAMSAVKRRRNRQAFLSKQDTFEVVKDSASNLASARCAMAFQDVKDVAVSSGIVQFQPWMGAVKAASMQAAAFYRAIFNKGINASGIIQAAGDFKDNNMTQLEQALEAGLLPAQKKENGVLSWVSDQTTWTRNDNFVFNSIQAMYAMDTVALTIASRMEEAFVGQSLADVTASLALGALSGICFDLVRLKLLGPSDDAPKGFKNAVIRIAGPVMYVSLDVKLATSLYLIPITIQVEQINQTASSG